MHLNYCLFCQNLFARFSHFFHYVCLFCFVLKNNVYLFLLANCQFTCTKDCQFLEHFLKTVFFCC
jgi:hypothetical protein